MIHQTPKSRNGRSIGRRAFLSGAAASIVSLAGCAGGGSDGGGSGGTESNEQAVSQSDTFEDVSVNGGDLEVTLAPDVSANWIHRYGPDGEMAEKAMVPPTGEPAQLDLVGSSVDETYTAGEQTIRAIQDGETVGETTIDISPNVTLTDVRWAKNHPEMDVWEKNGKGWDEHVALVFENSGNGPAELSSARWESAPFTFRNEGSVEEYEHGTAIPPGETTPIRSEAPVFKVSGNFVDANAVRCGEIDIEELQLTASIEPGANETFSQTVEYNGERSDCSLSIVEGGA